MLRPLCANEVVEPREFHVEDLAIQEQQRVQRLVLRRCRDVVANGERREKRGDFRGAHLGGMPLAVEKDVSLDPVDVRLLGATAVVARPDGVTNPVEQLPFRRIGRGAFTKHGRRRESSGLDRRIPQWHR